MIIHHELSVLAIIHIIHILCNLFHSDNVRYNGMHNQTNTIQSLHLLVFYRKCICLIFITGISCQIKSRFNKSIESSLSDKMFSKKLLTLCHNSFATSTSCDLHQQHKPLINFMQFKIPSIACKILHISKLGVNNPGNNFSYTSDVNLYRTFTFSVRRTLYSQTNN